MRNAKWVAAVAAALALGLLTLPRFLTGGSSAVAPGPDGMPAGESCKAEGPANLNLTLKDMNDADYKLSELKGKVVLVNFWASWCDPCRDEAPLVERTHKAMARRDGTVLGIDTRDASEDAAKFATEFGLTYPSLRDGSGDFSDEYSITGYPETFVLDRKGRIAAARRGPITQEWVDEHVMPLLDEQA